MVWWCSCEMRHAGMWDQRKYHVSVCVCVKVRQHTPPHTWISLNAAPSPGELLSKAPLVLTSLSFSLTRAKSQDPLAHLPDSSCVNVCMTIASLLGHKDLHSLYWAWERKYTCNSTRTLKVTRSVKPLHFCSDPFLCPEPKQGSLQTVLKLIVHSSTMQNNSIFD